MATSGLRQRKEEPKPDLHDGLGEGIKIETQEPHPAGPIKHGVYMGSLRIVLFGLYSLATLTSIHIAQFIGAPLYFYNQDWYYAWMAVMKQNFGLVVTTATQWWSPTVVRVSGDKSVAGQIRQTKEGRLVCDFPERLVLFANHQIYTDWLYLWWIAYTARMHGHIYIILKESLRYIPFLGPGMMFYGFIFLTRQWVKDKPRFQHRLNKLNSKHKGPMAGREELDPMWLLIFPEGTNLSINTRPVSTKWAQKSGTTDLQHALLPRSTGLLYCLQELRDTVDWVYDCTIAYEGVPRGQYAQDLFTIHSIYFQGRPPKSVNLHWRRFAVSSIPLDDQKAFEKWLEARWREKDNLLEHYVATGRFPGEEDAVVGGAAQEVINGTVPGAVKPKKTDEHIETEVCQSNPFEFLQIFAPMAALALIINIITKFWRMLAGPSKP